MWLILLCAACAPRVMTGVPLPTEQQRTTLSVDPDHLTYDPGSGVARFTPGANVQSAAYDVYEIDLFSLERVLGGRLTVPVVLVVELGPPTVTTYTPEDPMLPAPIGGFQITTRKATVLGTSP